uniref:CCHC-type domain-containing protein n=1 Tax=Strongyloides venezuelensis TaxID=75913 RepID=A0A0K0FS47_STRVS
MGAQPRQLSAVLNQALCKAKIQQLENKNTLLELIEVLTPEEFSKIQLLMPEDTKEWSSTLLVSCAKSIDCVSQTVKPSIYSQFVEILLRRFDPRDNDKEEIQIEEFLQQCTIDLPSEFAEMKLRDIFDQVKLIQIMGNKSRSLFTWNESKTSAELIMITKTHYLSQRSIKQEPKDVKESRKTKDDAVSNKDRVCYECQEKGHMKPDCPKLKKPTTMKVAKISRNVDDYNVSPVKGQMFQFAVPGETPIYHEAYLDTMAEITVISLATWEKLGSPPLSKPNHQLVGAGEVPLETEGIVTLTIKAQGKEATIDVVVMKNQDSCLMDSETYLKFFDGFNCAMLKQEFSTETTYRILLIMNIYVRMLSYGMMAYRNPLSR